MSGRAPSASKAPNREPDGASGIPDFIGPRELPIAPGRFILGKFEHFVHGAVSGERVQMNWLSQLFVETFQSFIKSMFQGAFETLFAALFFWFPGV